MDLRNLEFPSFYYVYSRLPRHGVGGVHVFHECLPTSSTKTYPKVTIFSTGRRGGHPVAPTISGRCGRRLPRQCVSGRARLPGMSAYVCHKNSIENIALYKSASIARSNLPLQNKPALNLAHWAGSCWSLLLNKKKRFERGRACGLRRRAEKHD